MPRQARVVAAGLPHHVYLRGNNRRRLFGRPTDYLRYIDCFARGLDASGCALHQLTLMTNHVHLVVTPPTAPALAVLVQRANQRYAQLRNQARSASGKLFEERFHSKIIDDERYLLSVSIYNDVNAYRAGIVDTPFAHEWSTGPLHAAYAGGRIPAAMWTPSSVYVSLGSSPAARAHRYRELVAAYLGRPPIETYVDSKTSAEDIEPYRRRLERPDRTRAAEQSARWPQKRL
jgi:putative transposase